jgi:hypothetical protein
MITAPEWTKIIHYRIINEVVLTSVLERQSDPSLSIALH